MARACVVLALLTALLAADLGGAAPEARRTYACAQAGVFFNVQVAGHKQAGYWMRLHHETFAAIPATEPVVALWSFGTQATREPVLYGWSTQDRARVRSSCRALGSARAPAARGLRAPVRVKKGWSLAHRYECSFRGRVVIRTETVAGGTRVMVWMEPSRRVVAAGQVVGGVATIGVSRRCLERSV